MSYTPEPWILKEAKTTNWDSDGDIGIIANIGGIGHIIAEFFRVTAYGTIQPVQGNAQLFMAGPNLLRVAEATLLFHSPAPWTPEMGIRWQKLTGTTECTTRNLCDFARSVVAKAKGEEST